MKIWRWVFLCIAVGSVCLIAVGVHAASLQQSVSEKVIRLHVIANSDSEEDQRVKLEVRDAVLALLKEHRWNSREESEVWITQNTEVIETVCRNRLTALGQEESARVVLQQEKYPTRQYDTFSLPAGNYLSLKIVLGEGAGKNWWCVVYPSVCMLSATDLQYQAVSAGFTEEEISFITEESDGIQIKFKLLEWIGQWKKK